MIKWIMYGVLALLVVGSWMLYTKPDREIARLDSEIAALQEKADPEEQIPGKESEKNSLEGEKTFNGILLTFLAAGLVGIFFVLTVLPFLAQRVTHAVYDSGEEVEKNHLHAARSLIAQGDYEGAIEAFKQAAAADPLNRLPWVEIAKIQKTNLEDPAAAIQTIRHALESQEWEVNDAAYFLFRLAELYDEVEGDRASAVAIMHQVIEQFPETRHSANAAHKLHEWKVTDEAATAAAEEAEYLARVQRGGQ